MNLKTVILITLIISGLASCSTVKETTQNSQAAFKMPDWKVDLKNISIKSSINASAESRSFVANANVNIAGMDSVSMAFFALGLQLGKLYATPDFVRFYNTFTNQLLEGTPSDENMKAVMMVPLSYFDFIHLIRCETPGNPKDFVFEEKLNNGEILFKNMTKADYIEYAVITSDNKLSQYQRKLTDGTLILHVFFNEYQTNDNIDFSLKQSYKFPEFDANLIMEINELELNKVFQKPFGFNIPDGVQRINLNEN